MTCSSMGRIRSPYKASRSFRFTSVDFALETILTCLIFVGLGGLVAIILPGLRPVFKHDYKEAVADGEIRKKSRFITRDNLEKLVSALLRGSLGGVRLLTDTALPMKYARMLIDEFKALHDAANPTEFDTPEVRWYMSLFASLTEIVWPSKLKPRSTRSR